MMPNPPVKRRRVELTLGDKVKLIKKYESSCPKPNQSELGKEFSIGRSTVSDILKQRQLYLDQFENNGSLFKRRVYGCKYQEINELVKKWYDQARATEKTTFGDVTGPHIMTKALEIASQLGIAEFKASTGWLEHWRRRYAVSIINTSVGESHSTETTEGHSERAIKAPEMGIDNIANDEPDVKHDLMESETGQYSGGATEAPELRISNIAYEQPGVKHGLLEGEGSQYSSGSTGVLDGRIDNVDDGEPDVENQFLHGERRQYSDGKMELQELRKDNIINEESDAKQGLLQVEGGQYFDGTLEVSQPVRRRRVELTLGDKVKLIKKYESSCPKPNRSELGKEFSIGRSTVGDILKQRQLYLDQFDNGSLSKRRVYDCKYQEINELVWKWYDQARAVFGDVTGPHIMTKALEIASQLGIAEFKASTGWLDHWRRRYAVSIINTSAGESHSTETAEGHSERAIKAPELRIDNIANDEPVVKHDLIESETGQYSGGTTEAPELRIGNIVYEQPGVKHGLLEGQGSQYSSGTTGVLDGRIDNLDHGEPDVDNQFLHNERKQYSDGKMELQELRKDNIINEESGAKPGLLQVEGGQCFDGTLEVLQPVRRRRVELTLGDKVKLIKKYESSNYKLNQSQLGQEFSIGRSTVSEILKQRQFYLDQFQNNASPFKRRFYECKYREVNELVWKWYDQARVVFGAVTGPHIKTKALEIASQLGISEFKASNGWLDNWRRRYVPVINTFDDGSHSIETTKGCSEGAVKPPELLRSDNMVTEEPDVKKELLDNEDHVYNIRNDNLTEMIDDNLETNKIVVGLPNVNGVREAQPIGTMTYTDVLKSLETLEQFALDKDSDFLVPVQTLISLTNDRLSKEIKENTNKTCH